MLEGLIGVGPIAGGEQHPVDATVEVEALASEAKADKQVEAEKVAFPRGAESFAKQLQNAAPFMRARAVQAEVVVRR